MSAVEETVARQLYAGIEQATIGGDFRGNYAVARLIVEWPFQVKHALMHADNPAVICQRLSKTLDVHGVHDDERHIMVAEARVIACLLYDAVDNTQAANDLLTVISGSHSHVAGQALRALVLRLRDMPSCVPLSDRIEEAKLHFAVGYAA